MKVRYSIALLAGAASLLVGGCAGGGQEENKVASVATGEQKEAKGENQPADSGGSDEDKMRAFAKCMREHGIDMPDPEPGNKGAMRAVDAGGDQAKMEAANEACKKLLPNGGEPKKMDAAEVDRMRQTAKCMREHGIDMPDPDPNGAATMRIGGEGTDKAKLDEAMKACGMNGPGAAADDN
ncbi:hypothetical protein [Amycolatopsis nigrescens]|uniref:hypothetical protein n=1 Tax=Amycolatopsis nigrescens TaxID=381445 RepID=UPI00037B3189|nr:hypothetical protein [Amycolatopsis nigrescens]